MTDHDCPPAPHSSLEDISQEEENEIEDVNDDGNPTNQDRSPVIRRPSNESDTRQEENEVNAENDDGNGIANQPTYLSRFSTWLIAFSYACWESRFHLFDESKKAVIFLFHLIPSARDVKLFIKEGSAWGWIDQLDPIEKYPINWKLPRIPYPKAVLFYEKKIKPPPIHPKSSPHDILAFLSHVDKSTMFTMPIPAKESEYREGVIRECTSRWQSVLSQSIVDEAVSAAAAALTLKPFVPPVPVEDPSEMEEREAAVAAVMEYLVSAVDDQEPMVVDESVTAVDVARLLSTVPTEVVKAITAFMAKVDAQDSMVEEPTAAPTEEPTAIPSLEDVVRVTEAALGSDLDTVTAPDTMVVEESTAEPTEEPSMEVPLEEAIDETAAGAALESVVAAVSDQAAMALDETPSDTMNDMLPYIEAIPVRDDRRPAEDAAELPPTVVEGPIEETAMATDATMERVNAPMEEDVIEAAPVEETAVPVGSVTVLPPMNYRRALSKVCRHYCNKIQAKADEVTKNEVKYLTLNNCNGQNCEQRVHAVTCHGQCRTRGTCDGQCRTRGKAKNEEN